MPINPVRHRALIIGNNDYQSEALRELRTAVGDAKAVAAVLRTTGTGVTELLNANRHAINEARNAFAEEIRDGGIGFFWFSGHGVQVQGKNILLATDTNPVDQYSTLDDGIDLDELIHRWTAVAPKALILVIDACRVSPFSDSRYRGVIGAGQGLSDLRGVPPGVLVVYSAGANQIALDNLGPSDCDANGLFAREFLRRLNQQPPVEFRTLIHETRANVHLKARSIGRDQIPAIYDQLIEYVVLTPQHPVGLVSPIFGMIREDMVRQWGLADFPPEEQDSYIEKIGELLYKSILLRAVDILDDAQAAEFEALVDQKGESMDAAQALDWLRSRISNFDQIAAEERARLSEELLAPGMVQHQNRENTASASPRIDPDEACRNGDRARDRGDFEEAVRWYQLAAEHDNPMGQVNLGFLYQKGQGVAINESEAVRWFARAAALGNALGQRQLAWAYDMGRGVAQDLRQAMYWYHKAADQGESFAQGKLGEFYETGRGGSPVNLPEAARLYRRAAEKGWPFAQCNFGRLCANGWGVEQNAQEAFSWFWAAAQQGDVLAQARVGEAYYSGLGAKQDHSGALTWFRKAADQSHSFAMNRLGEMYYDGCGVSRDYLEALNWFRKAAAQGDASGQTNVGDLYYHGHGVPQDYAEALRWFHQAANQGYRVAQGNIGYMYAEGLGVPRDLGQARSWMEKAAANGFEDAKEWLSEH